MPEFPLALLLLLLWLNVLPPSNASATGIANAFFLDKQRFILEIVQRVEEPFLNEQVLRSGCDLVLDNSAYLSIHPTMKRFYASKRNGDLLPRDAHFTPFAATHLQQATGLFYYFYLVQDWQFLRFNICWARVHVNAGMFIFALTQALLKRDDYSGLALPQIYELLPEHFHGAAFVRQAQRFNYAIWRMRTSQFNQRPQLQTYACSPQPASIADLRNTSAWLRATHELQFLCLESAATRQRPNLLSDVQWHAHWYYQNMGVLLSGVENDVDVQTLREWWYWNLQQLLARHELEHATTPPTHAPAMPLLSWTGRPLQPLPAAAARQLDQRFRQLQRLVQQAISEQSVTLPDGSWLSLTQADNWQRFMHAIFNFNVLQLFATNATPQPHYLLNLETMLHAPEFYKYAGMLLHAQQQLKSHFQPYQLQHLLAPSLEFNAVSISPLITYDAPLDVDISNLLSNRHFYYEGIFMWQKSLQARQPRLWHEPFQLTFNISSSQTQAAIVRSFLVNGCTASGARCSYFQLDTFVSSLAAGVNIIERQSRSFFGTVRQPLSYSELYRYNLLALEEQFEFPLNISTASCGFPNRLVLPRGEEHGLPLRMVFVTTPYTNQLHMGRNVECNYGSGITHFDDLPFGFPFDRAWGLDDNEPTAAGSDLSRYDGLPNMHWQDVKIYHSNKVT